MLQFRLSASNFATDEAYTNCTLRCRFDRTKTFSALENVEWMPLVYEDLLASPSVFISKVQTFYGFEDETRIQTATQRVAEQDATEWKALRRVIVHDSTHDHDNEEPPSKYNTLMLDRWYRQLITAARVCSFRQRPN